MKKKITLVATSVLLVAAMVIGGTLAYFTDTDAKTNTFTTGNVDITLQENFDAQNAKLLPGKENAVTKEVWIELEQGSEDAYVWYTYAIPAHLDSTDSSTGTSNIVHVNAPGNTWDKYRENNAYWTEDQTEALPEAQTWDHDPNVELADISLVGPEGYIGSYTGEDGILYNVYLILYHGVLSAGESTTFGMKQVYMDAGVDVDEDGNYTKNGAPIAFDFENNDINIVVRAYAIQEAGFTNVYEAYKAFPVDVTQYE